MTSPNEVINLALKFATAKYKEGRNNDTIFGKWYGLNYNPWCAMFVSYCFNKAGAGKLVATTNKKGFASCSAGLAYYKSKGRVIPKTQAQAGDIVFFSFDGNSDPDHVGIVLGNKPGSKTMLTVEGNTWSGKAGSQVNGDGVYKRVRLYQNIVAVVRPAWKKAPTVIHVPKPVVPKAVYTTVRPGEGWWLIAVRTLKVRNTQKNAEKIGREAIRLRALNKNRALHPGEKVRIK